MLMHWLWFYESPSFPGVPPTADTIPHSGDEPFSFTIEDGDISFTVEFGLDGERLIVAIVPNTTLSLTLERRQQVNARLLDILESWGVELDSLRTFTV